MAAIFGGKKEKKSKSVIAIEEILDEADGHLKGGETDKAASEYRRAHRYLYREENLAEAPIDFAELFTRTGHGLYETGEPDRAIECFDKATQLNPKNTIAWMSRGIVHLKTETMLNFAIMCFEEVLKLEPDNQEAMENQAEAYMLSGKKDDAVETYKKLIELVPDNEEYRTKLNEMEPVNLETVTAKLKKTPKDVNLWKIRAKLLEDEGQTAKAIESYLRVGYLEKKPDAYEKVLELNPKNKTALDKLLKLKPDDQGYMVRKAEILLAEGEKEEALELYQRLSELDPANNDYAEKVRELKPDEMEEVESILATDPNNLEALSKKAAILGSRGDQGAGDIFMKLVQLEPQNTAHYEGALKFKPDAIGLLKTKGELHFDKEEYDKSLECYAKVAQLKPDDVDALHNKGAAQFKLERFDDAVKTFDQIIAIDPEDTIAYLTKGAALFKSGQIDPAVEALNNVVKRDPEDAAAWYYKSCAEAKKGNLKPVVPFLTRAIDMEEDFRERAKTDECFAPVKDTPEFKALFE